MYILQWYLLSIMMIFNGMLRISLNPELQTQDSIVPYIFPVLVIHSANESI